MKFPFLSYHGVLGMNARNLHYVYAYNQQKAIAFADDKLKTKAFLSARGIPTAKVYAEIHTRSQLRSFNFSVLPDTCVLKPNYGFGGEGIIILDGRKKGMFLERGKEQISYRELKRHIEDILDGSFSVNGRRDVAFFEQRLVSHSAFAPLRPAGLPDIRIIVFNLVPVMAMLRIPTGSSKGKANLHGGGIGFGIDMARGVTTYAVRGNNLIEFLPHGVSVRGHVIPFWHDMLVHASRIQQITNIGFLAVDFTIDDHEGPMLLEVNARAGLSVQVANLAPLQERLERVKGLQVSTPEKGALLSEQLFGDTRPQMEKEDVPTIGVTETISIPTAGGTIEARATVSLEHERTTISEAFLITLLKEGAVEPIEGEKDRYRIRFTLGNRKIQTIVATESNIVVPVMLGRRDIAGFLVDPGKATRLDVPIAIVRADLFEIDRQLTDVQRRLMPMKYLRPTNLLEESTRAMTNALYEPQFVYAPLAFDAAEERDTLLSLCTDDTPYGQLLAEKRDELLRMIDLLVCREDHASFTDASIALFGDSDTTLLRQAEEYRQQDEGGVPPEKSLKARMAMKRFQETLIQYGMHDWTVILREDMVADCAVGQKRIAIRKDATFTSSHIDALIAHEIEAHALTQENARHQPYPILRAGVAHYLETQEGLALHLQNRVLPKGHPKRTWAALNVLGIDRAKRLGFAALWKELQALGFTKEKAFRKALSFKRGIRDTSKPGCFSKDTVYLRGLIRIEQFLQDGGDLRSLYVGRSALNNLHLIEKLEHIKKPFILPLFLVQKK